MQALLLSAPPRTVLQPRFAPRPSAPAPRRAPAVRARGHVVAPPPPPRGVSVVVQAAPGHAPLHDFCLLLPVGALQLVAGAIAGVLGARATGAAVAALGATCLATAVLSLAAWRRGAASTPYTLTAALASAGAAAWMWPRVGGGATAARAGVGAVGAVAAALAANVALGGNAPRRGKAAAA